MKKILFAWALLIACGLLCRAQRPTDQLDRGLVVIPTGSTSGSKTNVVTWRRLAGEYYDVKYNLYKDGQRVATNLDATCYADNTNGLPATQYAVAPVVRGVEQAQSAVATAWKQYVYKSYANNRYPTAYLDIALANVYDRDGNDVTAHYEPNDAELADLDGDGQLEIIIKRLNTVDAAGYDSGLKDAKGQARYIIYPKESKEFVVLDAYDVDWQTGAATLLWRIDCGPNMVSANSTEINIVAYDWDEDGRAEVVLRGADNMIVYGSDGKTRLYTIGDMNVNTRPTWYTSNEKGSSTASLAYTNTGAEYLIYMNGETGALYQKTDYPLTRGKASDWGDTSGHRSSKYFMGAPFLDGRHASLFLGRGIYTRHKMMAMDLNVASHTWSERWSWNCSNSSSPWYGNGYHNFIVADVDEDGRDEIVYGSMVIDDNGKGLSTTGLGHGDAQHVSDFDPFRKGLEFFGCNEDKPGMNYRNATTSDIYIRRTAGEDDGRGLMANFSNTYPGSQGRSVSTAILSSVSDAEISELGGDGFINWGDLNFRIYWDGDLCSEVLNSPGTAKEAKVEKPGFERIFASTGCNMNNDSKNNPCFQGDIIGDWREEIVVRCGQGLRVYTTGLWTNYSLPTLWSDHQYRQAMVWQMMAYNQPPHLSYFLGEMEGITQAPPPLTMDGREEIGNGTCITSAMNDKHLLLCLGEGSANVGIDANGAAPYILTLNVASTVSGNDDNSNITTSYATCQLGATMGGKDMKGDLTGAMRLVKQGDGLLKMTARTFSYTGETQVWGGALYFGGTLENSPLWMNRHTTLYTAGTYKKTVTLEYGATLRPGKNATTADALDYGETNIETLELHEGARVVFQMNGTEHDAVNIGQLNLRTRNWEYGPKYLAPVFEIQSAKPLADGMYPLGALKTMGRGSDLKDIVVEGVTLVNGQSPVQLVQKSGMMYLAVGELDDNGEVVDKSFYETVWTLDFEEASTNNYGFVVQSGGVESMAQTEHADGSHFFHIYQGSQNDRTVNLSFAGNTAFSSAKDYRLEFDLGIVGSNSNASTITLAGSAGTLMTINYAAWANKATVADAEGTAVGEVTISPYVKNQTLTVDYVPSIFNHFVITASEKDGVRLSVTCGKATVIDDVLLSADFSTIVSLSSKMGRYYSHMAYDDIVLSYRCAGLGDVNCDGVVSVADVTALVNHILNRTVQPFSQTAADVNRDGTVSVADVTVLVNKILGK